MKKYSENYVAIDLETSGLAYNSRIFLIGLAWLENGKIESKSINVGISSLLWGFPPPVPEQISIVKSITKGKKLVFHNGSFDIPFLLRDKFFNVEDLWGRVQDTLILSRMVGGYERVSLEYLSDYFNLDEKLALLGGKRIKEIIEKYNWVESKGMRGDMEVFVNENLPQAMGYVEMDSAVTLLLFEELMKKANVYYKNPQLLIDAGDLSVLSAKMRYDGICLNVDRIDKERAEKEKELHDLMKNVLLPNRISAPNNRLEMVSYLNSKTNIPIPKTEKGNPNIDDKSLMRIRDNASSDVQNVIDSVLRARHLEKLLSTWLVGMRSDVDLENRVHPLFRAGGTVSGRFSCQYPSAHTVPRELKKWYFVPGTDAAALAKIDFSQAEVRLGTLYAKSNKMARLISSGADIHLETAKMVWGENFINNLSQEEIKKYRHIAKQGRFATQYGAGAKTLVRVIEGLGYEEAKSFLTEYRRAFPELHFIMVKASEVWDKRGYLKLWDGTLLWKTPRYEDKLYAAFNQLIQPGVARVVINAMLKIQRSNLPVRIVNQVHDEIVFEVLDVWDKKDVLDIIDEVRKIMETSLPEEISNWTNPPVYMEAEPEIIWNDNVE